MARIKYFNTNTGTWEYADSQYNSSDGNTEYVGTFVLTDETTGLKYRLHVIDGVLTMTEVTS